MNVVEAVCWRGCGYTVDHSRRVAVRVNVQQQRRSCLVQIMKLNEIWEPKWYSSLLWEILSFGKFLTFVATVKKLPHFHMSEKINPLSDCTHSRYGDSYSGCFNVCCNVWFIFTLVLVPGIQSLLNLMVAAAGQKCDAPLLFLSKEKQVF